MKKKTIFVLNGNPDPQSLGHDLAEAYANGARKAGHSVTLTHVHALTFDPILHHGYREIQELEPDLKQVQQDMLAADHMVLVTPMWWGGVPALLKGLFDRILVPGVFFNFVPGQKLPYPKIRKMKGTSVRVLYTSGSNKYIMMIGLADSFWRTLKRMIFWYIGCGPIKRTVFDGIKKGISPQKIQQYLNRAEALGSRGA
jgi:putative NADPH-quinone reductase